MTLSGVMMKRQTLPILFMSLFTFFMWETTRTEAACTGSSPKWTSTADQTSVSACVNSAVSGDTITVTGSGTVTWSSPVSSTKAIKLIGPGRTNLTIIGRISFNPSTTEASKIFEVAGFTFSGNQTFNATTPNSSTPITSLKIHDNAFINATGRAIWLGGLEWGVFYKNTFDNNNIHLSVIGAGDAGWDIDGCSTPNLCPVYGTARYAYFEDNTFNSGQGGFVSETGQGGRLVFRYNTITNYSGPGWEALDIHGDQNSGRGTVASEYYHNSIDVGTSGTFRWMHHRGGQAIIANNSINRSVAFNITEYRAWGGNGICSTYPAVGQINHSFYWNNIAGGAQQAPTYTNGNGGSCGSDPPWGDNQYVVPNREYWLLSSGLEANRPATCTANGNTFYGTTDTDKLYKCTATNVWTVYYQPYPYPHPLRAGSSPSVTVPPPAPTNLLVN